MTNFYCILKKSSSKMAYSSLSNHWPLIGKIFLQCPSFNNPDFSKTLAEAIFSVAHPAVILCNFN